MPRHTTTLVNSYEIFCTSESKQEEIGNTGILTETEMQAEEFVKETHSQ